MPNAYTEDQLVEQPAIGLFAELCWDTVSALEESLGAIGTWLRETKGEVVWVSRLRAPFERLNPAFTPEAIGAAVSELPRDRSAMLKLQVQHPDPTRDLLLPKLPSWQANLAQGVKT